MRYKNIEGVGTETSPTPIMRVVIVVLFVLASIWVQPKGGVAAQDGGSTVGVFGRELPGDASAGRR
jgi:hypothetical protein